MKNGKIFGKINLIDFLVIVGLVAACIGFGIRIVVSNASLWSEDAVFEYVVRVDGIREFTVQGLEKSEEIIGVDNDKVIGKITNVTTENSKSDLIVLDGERKFIERPDRFLSYVTIQAEGNLVDGSFVDADETAIYTGGFTSIRTKQVVTSGQIVSVRRLEENEINK